MSQIPSRAHKPIFLILTIIFLCSTFLLLLSKNMQEPLHHDEHMYVSSGAMLAEQGMLPYKDYAYFQMPDLVFVYAAIFKGVDFFTNGDRNLLAARTFSTICAMLLLGLIFYIATTLFRGSHYLIRFLIAAGSVVLIAANPLFTSVSGLTWNHDLAVLFAMLAFVVHSQAVKRDSNKWLFSSGLLLGLAIGTRFSFAPAIAAFGGLILLYPNLTLQRKKLYALLAFGAGLLVALLPVLTLFALAPTQFEFGNFIYHSLNAAYRESLGPSDESLFGKLRLFVRLMVEPGTLPLVLGFLFFVVWSGISKVRAKTSRYFEVLFLVALLPFLLVGSLGPTPSAPRYFYQLIPFLVLGLLYGIAYFREQAIKMNRGLQLFALAVVVTGFVGFSSYQHLGNLLSEESWTPIEANEVGAQIKHAVGDGQILTLAPIYPLEEGGKIYKEFAAAPFGWRIGSLLGSSQRKQYDIVSKADLENYLKTKPPQGILVGDPLQAALEQPLVDYAKEHGYRPLQLENGETLWLIRHAAMR